MYQYCGFAHVAMASHIVAVIGLIMVWKSAVAAAQNATHPDCMQVGGAPLTCDATARYCGELRHTADGEEECYGVNYPEHINTTAQRVAWLHAHYKCACNATTRRISCNRGSSCDATETESSGVGHIVGFVIVGITVLIVVFAFLCAEHCNRMLYVLFCCGCDCGCTQCTSTSTSKIHLGAKTDGANTNSVGSTTV